MNKTIHYDTIEGKDIFGNDSIIKVKSKNQKQEIQNLVADNLQFNETIEMVKIQSNSICIFKHNDTWTPGNKKHNVLYDENWNEVRPDPIKRPENITNGFISDKASARLRNSVKILFWIAGCFRLVHGKFLLKPQSKITFLTLTLSYTQQHTDNYIKSKMLNQFIIELKQKYPKLLYIWRAEKQLNENIHFHFLINMFIPWDVPRAIWNRIQKKEGYIQAYQQKFSGMDFWNYCFYNNLTNPAKLDTYRKRYNYGVKTNWTDPNSTDIQPVKKMKNVEAYVSKYISKNLKNFDSLSEEQKEKMKIEGRIYYCCTEISGIKPKSTELEPYIQDDLNILKNLIPDKFYSQDFYTLISVTADQLYNFGCFLLFNIFINYILPINPSIFNTT